MHIKNLSNSVGIFHFDWYPLGPAPCRKVMSRTSNPPANRSLFLAVHVSLCSYDHWLMVTNPLDTEAYAKVKSFGTTGGQEQQGSTRFVKIPSENVGKFPVLGSPSAKPQRKTVDRLDLEKHVLCNKNDTSLDHSFLSLRLPNPPNVTQNPQEFRESQSC